MNRRERRAGEKLRRKIEASQREIDRELDRLGRLEDLDDAQRQKLAALTSRRLALEQDLAR